MGGTPAGDIGGMQLLLNVGGAGYILGGLVFGYAYIKWWDWKKGAHKRDFQRKLEVPVKPVCPKERGEK